MAETCTSEYVEASKRQETIVLKVHLEMVTDIQPNPEENWCESDDESISHDECFVDGILQPNTRGSLMKVKECQVLIQGIRKTSFHPGNIRPKRSRACMDNLSSEITIYYYKSNIVEDLGQRVPVLLNIGDSNEFLKCTFMSSKAVLTVENLEKDSVNLIYKNDPIAWPFVFFLSLTKDNCRRFESAECSGWFIRTESESVCMDEHKDKDLEKYLFMIKSCPNATKAK